MTSSKYSKEELRDMAIVVLEHRGTDKYRTFVSVLSFYNQIPISEVVEKIEEMANA